MDAAQLAETTLNPDTRVFKQITIEDLKKSESLIRDLMGDDVAPRKDFIFSNANEIYVQN